MISSTLKTVNLFLFIIKNGTSDIVSEKEEFVK